MYRRDLNVFSATIRLASRNSVSLLIEKFCACKLRGLEVHSGARENLRLLPIVQDVFSKKTWYVRYQFIFSSSGLQYIETERSSNRQPRFGVHKRTCCSFRLHHANPRRILRLENVEEALVYSELMAPRVAIKAHFI